MSDYFSAVLCVSLRSLRKINVNAEGHRDTQRTAEKRPERLTIFLAVLYSSRSRFIR